MADPAEQLYDAFCNEDYDEVNELINRHGGFNKVVNEYGYTALHFAAYKGDVPVLQKIWKMKTQPPIGLRTNDGSTALHLGNMGCIVSKGGKQNSDDSIEI